MIDCEKEETPILIYYILQQSTSQYIKCFSIKLIQLEKIIESTIIIFFFNKIIVSGRQSVQCEKISKLILLSFNQNNRQIHFNYAIFFFYNAKFLFL